MTFCYFKCILIYNIICYTCGYIEKNVLLIYVVSNLAANALTIHDRIISNATLLTSEFPM